MESLIAAVSCSAGPTRSTSSRGLRRPRRGHRRGPLDAHRRTDRAGDIDDLVLISRTGGISYFVSGDPERRFATFERMKAAVQPGWDVRIDDRTETTCLIGLAGPGAAQAAQDHLEGALPSRLQLLHCVMFEFHGFRTLAIRTSDFGEDGFEFMVAPAVAQHMIETLNAVGVPLAGFEAQEMARVESCIPSVSYDAFGLSPAEADRRYAARHRRWRQIAAFLPLCCWNRNIRLILARRSWRTMARPWFASVVRCLTRAVGGCRPGRHRFRPGSAGSFLPGRRQSRCRHRQAILPPEITHRVVP